MAGGESAAAAVAAAVARTLKEIDADLERVTLAYKWYKRNKSVKEANDMKLLLHRLKIEKLRFLAKRNAELLAQSKINPNLLSREKRNATMRTRKAYEAAATGSPEENATRHALNESYRYGQTIAQQQGFRNKNRNTLKVEELKALKEAEGNDRAALFGALSASLMTRKKPGKYRQINRRMQNRNIQSVKIHGHSIQEWAEARNANPFKYAGWLESMNQNAYTLLRRGYKVAGRPAGRLMREDEIGEIRERVRNAAAAAAAAEAAAAAAKAAATPTKPFLVHGSPEWVAAERARRLAQKDARRAALVPSAEELAAARAPAASGAALTEEEESPAGEESHAANPFAPGIIKGFRNAVKAWDLTKQEDVEYLAAPADPETEHKDYKRITGLYEALKKINPDLYRRFITALDVYNAYSYFEEFMDYKVKSNPKKELATLAPVALPPAPPALMNPFRNGSIEDEDGNPKTNWNLDRNIRYLAAPLGSKEKYRQLYLEFMRKNLEGYLDFLEKLKKHKQYDIFKGLMGKLISDNVIDEISKIGRYIKIRNAKKRESSDL